MTKEEITNRIALLYLSLQFCKEKIKMFTPGERICINQERFQWLHILSNAEAVPRPVSAVIEKKINSTVKLVEEYHFKPSLPSPFYEETENLTEEIIVANE